MQNAFRCWGGPVVGETVGHAWHGYAAALFFEFGKLKPATYTLRDGTPGQPRGEFTLTSMDSFASWKLLLSRKLIATSDGRFPQIGRMIKRLIGRRLRMFEIDAVSRATRLTFSGGVVLITTTFRDQLNRPPHWILRLPSSGPDNWPSVILGGTPSTTEQLKFRYISSHASTDSPASPGSPGKDR